MADQSSDDVRRAAEQGFNAGQSVPSVYRCNMCGQLCELVEAPGKTPYRITKCCSSGWTATDRPDPNWG